MNSRSFKDIFDAPVRQASTLDEVEHRPWPVPDGSWVMGQTWDDLLFIHYRIPVEQLRPLVPEGLEVEQHSGGGWLGVTPCVVTGLRARSLLQLPCPPTPAEAHVDLNTRPPLKVPQGDPLVHYSARQDVVIWPLTAA